MQYIIFEYLLSDGFDTISSLHDFGVFQQKTFTHFYI